MKIYKLDTEYYFKTKGGEHAGCRCCEAIFKIKSNGIQKVRWTRVLDDKLDTTESFTYDQLPEKFITPNI